MALFKHGRRLRASLLLACAAACGVPSFAQTYPDKPITLIVPYPPGAAVDRVARGLSLELGKRLGQSVIVDNVAGASGTVAGKRMLRTQPDGYTLMIGTVNELVVAPPVMKAGYTARDFTPIAKISNNSTVLVAHPGFGANTVDELIELGRKSREHLLSGATGTATMQTFGGTMLADAGGFKMTHVVYKGGSPLLNDLVAGQVQLGTIALTSALPFIRDGKLKAIGIISMHRDPTAANIPTVNEGKTVRNVQADLWTGLIGPARMPPAVVARLSSTVREIMASASYREAEFKSGSVVAEFAEPAAFGKFLAQEEERVRPLLANVKPE
ncbi:tripartite tricarboxylate transporter substrate binding protein [Variovorax sp. RB3P1]|uniref:tripartite tricarboxylate transporter substrate binding protein n=1 Tax=Variovorax sp. RB3P1 TaxID=3443732 RepID=UPI003F480D4C